MNKILTSFRIECNVACDSIYALLRQKNINCFKSDAADKDGYYICLDEKDLSAAINAVPVLADCEQNTVTVNTKFVLCNTVVGFDNIEESHFKILPCCSGEKFNTYDEARKVFLEMINNGSQNISIIKALFDEDNRVYLNESYIITTYFNLYNENI